MDQKLFLQSTHFLSNSKMLVLQDISFTELAHRSFNDGVSSDRRGECIEATDTEREPSCI